MGERQEGRGTRQRVFLVVGAISVGLVGLAVALPKVFPFLRGDRDAPLLLPDAPAAADALIVIAAIVLVVAAVALRLKVASIADPTAVRKRKPILLQILIVIGAFWLTALIVANITEGREERRGNGSTSESEEGGESTPPLEREGSRALGLMLTLVLGGMVVALAGSVYLITSRDKAKTAGPTADSLADELRVGIEDLRTGEDPRDVVLRCYARMERILLAAGTEARPSDTPHEFMRKALRGLRVPKDSVGRLTVLFERARFSSHGTDEEMRTEAVAALEDVRASLAGREDMT